jgi:ferritin
VQQKRSIMPNYSTIRIKPKTKNAADRLAEKYNMNLLEFYDAMDSYFDKTGLNPKDMVVLSPAEELKKFRDTIIAFMRKQEKDFIMPVFSRIDTVAMLLTNYLHENGNLPAAEKLKSNLNTPAELSQNQARDVEQIASKENPENVDSCREDFKKLQAEYDILELKYRTITEYFSKVIKSTENKSTGLNKMPVIGLPMAEINGFKDYLKRL